MRIALLISISCFFLLAINVFATTKTINSGSWLVAGNWSPSGLPVDGDDIIITGNVELPFQNNDIFLDNVTITITGTGYLTVKKKCDLTLDANSTIIINTGGSIEGTHGNSIAIIGTSGNLLGNKVYNGPRAANENGWNNFSTTPLPISLVSFLSKTFEDRIELEWKTASELNNDYFQVERNTDGSWESIGQVSGIGTSNELQLYEFTDYNVDASIPVFYRLRQIDFDGKEDFSNVIKSEVVVTPDEVYTVNQNGPLVELNFVNERIGKTTIQIVTSKGDKVFEEFFNAVTIGQKVEFDLSEYSSGWFVLGIIGSDNAHFKKMIIIN